MLPMLSRVSPSGSRQPCAHCIRHDRESSIYTQIDGQACWKAGAVQFSPHGRAMLPDKEPRFDFA